MTVETESKSVIIDRAPRNDGSRWQIGISAAVILTIVGLLGWGAVAGFQALNRAAAKADYNSLHAYGVNSHERDAINKQAETNIVVKTLLDNNYAAVNFTRIRDSYTVVFKQCGNASLTDCAERRHPSGNAMWVQVVMDKPANIKDPSTFHLRTKANLLFERKSYGQTMLYCMPQTQGWTLTADTFAIGGQIWTAFKDLDYDYANGFSQNKVVGRDEVYCVAGDAL